VQLKRSRADHPGHEGPELGDLPGPRFPNPRPPGFAFNLNAEREAARAAELEKRALKQSEKAMKLKEKFGEKGPVPEEFHDQLQALQQARETLQREMQKLERQIERIQRDHEHMERDHERMEREKQRLDRDERNDRNDRDEKDDEPHRK
jgi:hypothetical protein